MISVDTNVLVRILIDDESLEQVSAARKLAKKSKSIFITQVVQIELIWVLSRAYGLSKGSVLEILSELSQNAAFILQRDAQFDKALVYYQETQADFSDCLILAESEIADATVYTFDKKFLKLPGVKGLID